MNTSKQPNINKTGTSVDVAKADVNSSKSLEDLNDYLPDTMACDLHEDMDKCPVIKLKQAIVEAVEGIYGDSDGLREFASTGSSQVVNPSVNKRKE